MPYTCAVLVPLCVFLLPALSLVSATENGRLWNPSIAPTSRLPKNPTESGASVCDAIPIHNFQYYSHACTPTTHSRVHALSSPSLFTHPCSLFFSLPLCVFVFPPPRLFGSLSDLLPQFYLTWSSFDFFGVVPVRNGRIRAFVRMNGESLGSAKIQFQGHSTASYPKVKYTSL